MDPLEKCLQTAKNSGVGREQAERLLGCSYVPLPWQWEFHAIARDADKDGGPVDIGVGGARGPGKSHVVLSQAALDDCQRIPRLKGLFLRQTGTAAKESFDDLVEKVLLDHIAYKRAGMTLTFQNGSRIILGGFKDANDIDKYIGIEYDFIIIEELNQLTEEKHTKLRGSLRTSKSDWRPRIYASFNPGGVGHGFVKSRYVIPHRDKTEKDTRFVGSTYKSNPYLNKEYIEYLEGLTGDLGRAWREGDWDTFAGQVFSEFRYDIHVCNRVVPNPSYPHFLWIDWGYSGREEDEGAFSALAGSLIQDKYDGTPFNRVIVYKEWCGKYKTPTEWAEKIYRESEVKEYKRCVGDSAMFNTQTDGSKPISKLMEEEWNNLNKGHWVTMIPGTKNRIGRVATLHDWLSIAPDGLPYLLIAENCSNLIKTLPLLIYDEYKIEDVDTNSNDHAYDCLTYGLSAIKFISAKIGGIQKEPLKKKALPAALSGLDLSLFEKVGSDRSRDWKVT